MVALLNESMPHIFASLLTHMMATAWAGFQIYHTANFREEFNNIIVNGACVGTNLLPTYWEERSKAELPSLVLNIVAMFLSCFLTWNLIKVCIHLFSHCAPAYHTLIFQLFGWQTFKRVGASITINRVYKIVLILSIVIQLSLFFMAVTVCLWIDQLLNSVIGDLVDFLTLYKITSAITLAVSFDRFSLFSSSLCVPASFAMANDGVFFHLLVTVMSQLNFLYRDGSPFAVNFVLPCLLF